MQSGVILKSQYHYVSVYKVREFGQCCLQALAIRFNMLKIANDEYNDTRYVEIVLANNKHDRSQGHLLKSLSQCFLLSLL